MHHACDRFAVPEKADQRSPAWQACDKGARAINRIDDPAILRIDIAASGFFSDETVVGECRFNMGADCFFRLPVGLGYRVKSFSGQGACLVVNRGFRSETRKRFSLSEGRNLLQFGFDIRGGQWGLFLTLPPAAWWRRDCRFQVS
jgi:hypothetical protein